MDPPRVLALSAAAHSRSALERSPELARWAAFTAECFADKTNPPLAAYFTSKVLNDPFFEPTRDIVVATLRDGVTVVAALRVFHRRINGMDVLGIGEVGVAKQYRGQGIATQLVDFALALWQPACALLHASLPAARKTYARSGFVPLAPLVTFRLPRGRATTPRVLRSVGAHDAEALAALYAQHLSCIHGVFERSAQYFARWVVPRWERKGRAFICDTCYIYLLRKDEGWQVDEFAGPFRVFASALTRALCDVGAHADSHVLISGGLYAHLFQATAQADRLCAVSADDGWMAWGASGLATDVVFDSDSF